MIKHIDPFNFNFGIKFVDANSAGAGAGADANNFNLTQTGDMLGLIIGFILLAVAVGAFAFYFLKKRQDSLAFAQATSRRMAHARPSVHSPVAGTSL